MPMNTGQKPAARGPLAKIAISRASEITYEERDADEGKQLLETKGVKAIEAFNHPDFDKKKFHVFEWDLASSRQGQSSRNSWTITSHVMRDGVVVRKRFAFKCETVLKRIREIGQYEKAAKNAGEAKKPLKDRGGVL